jgi:arabinose-5-phosphate isomerase
LLLTNQQGELTGLFTDSDLARLLESQKDASFDRPICEVMTERPITVRAGSLTQVAVEILACHNISELPVVDADHRPVGLVDITDVVAFLPTNP